MAGDPKQPQPQQQVQRLTLEDLEAKTYRVTNVHVDGVEHTKPSLIEMYIAPLLKATTMGDIIAETQYATHQLQKLGIFKSVEVEFDTSETGGEGFLDVNLKVKEVPRLFARTGTEIGSNEGSMNASLMIRNAMGGAETLQASLSYGVETTTPVYSNTPFNAQTGTSFQIIAGKPVNGDPDKRLEVHLSRSNQNMHLYSSHSKNLTGAAARFKFLNALGGFHELVYDASWREVNDISSTASWSVRQNGGHTLKSSVSHSVTFDERNDVLLPTKGVYFKSSQELAGLGGDVKHVKGDAEGQLNVPLGLGFSLSASLKGGLLYPLGGSSTNIIDRYYLGGPQSIRGFKQHGVGPADGDDRVGGDLFFNGGLSLFTPLPFLVNKPLKGHLFFNGGNLIRADTTQPLESNFRRLLSAGSSSVGLGLAVRFSMLRFEMNWCLPVSVTSTDLVKPGLQFGVGLQFS
ncbi:hypothetical protein HDV05_004870 [Chytridiales sp. JEL 0842]|nr:hypothetical protein HDV05_004870 [Chytridiales sp. JEL 0842]